MKRHRGMVVAGACLLAAGQSALGQGVDETTCESFEGLGTFQASEVVASGVRVTALENYGFPGTVHVDNAQGLGVAGGPSDTTIDTGEGLRFDFDGFVATDA